MCCLSVSRASCEACYIVETNRNFNTRINKCLFWDKNSHIFKHLSTSKGCWDKFDVSSFKILDHASTYSQLEIKETFHVEQLKPELNKQVEHVSLLLHFLIKLLLFTGSFSLFLFVFHFIG